ncbi:hypothetical protein EWB00_001347 [Schistosoma japonicum]|uniref:Uncharacterized protein n=1 Tax=Schistosoma japonicum TaxID=6182 RepID=A0A4Z2DFV6_SCHJA|nr:hypothetical protein EWB00_001347 [Schistosoma japonicum]
MYDQLKWIIHLKVINIFMKTLLNEKKSDLNFDVSNCNCSHKDYMSNKISNECEEYVIVAFKSMEIFDDVLLDSNCSHNGYYDELNDMANVLHAIEESDGPLIDKKD